MGTIACCTLASSRMQTCGRVPSAGGAGTDCGLHRIVLQRLVRRAHIARQTIRRYGILTSIKPAEVA